MKTTEEILRDLMLPALVIGVSLPFIAPSLPPAAILGGYLSCGSLTVLLTNRKQPVEIILKKMFENRGLFIQRSKTEHKDLPKLVEKKAQYYGYELTYKMPLGLSDEELLRMFRGIEIGLNSEVELWPEDGFVKMRIYIHDLPKEIHWDEPFERSLPEMNLIEQTKNMVLPVLIGKSRAGLEFICLKSSPHTLIAGETGGGKTNLIRVILRNLIDPIVPCIRPIVCVIDVSRKLGYIRDRAFFAGDYDHIKGLILRIAYEMRRRYMEFEKMGVDEIDELPEELIDQYPRIVLIIDEFNSLSPKMAYDKQEREERGGIMAKLVEIITQGRGAGIHCVIGIQRPDAQVMHDGQIKANMPVRICFRTVDNINSRIVLDNDLASFIPPDRPGRCILRGKNRIRQVQILGMTHSYAKEHLLNLPDEIRSPLFPPLLKSEEQIKQIEDVLEEPLESRENSTKSTVLQLIRKIK